ncbi:unnamed protein product [Leptidea sinapis]|uniref:Uncharacterized protein n=1 Tax=Leptidea sinapis TaxID=189913 RepID=A0A5E4QUM3_9NEOP|nr:unnamed protein product [Leptidea sinapis]
MVHCCILGCRSRSPSEGRQQQILYTFHKISYIINRRMFLIMKSKTRLDINPFQYIRRNQLVPKRNERI